MLGRKTLGLIWYEKGQKSFLGSDTSLTTKLQSWDSFSLCKPHRVAWLGILPKWMAMWEESKNYLQLIN